MKLLILLCSIFFCVNGARLPFIKRELKAADCSKLDPKVISDITAHEDDLNKIIDLFISGKFKGKAYTELALLVDKHPRRWLGTKNLDNAVNYMVDASVGQFKRVMTQEVKVPKWTRLEERAKITSPIERPLHIIGLGSSVSTSPEGITAGVIVVKSFEDLEALKESDVKDKIVVYDQPYDGYGPTVQYRTKGASEAAKKKAVAALVRSITPESLNTPHTGNQDYEEGVERIPVAAISHEDADLLMRMQERKEKIEINLVLMSTNSSAYSQNVILDTEGVGNPGEVVLVSGHLDSWDVGDGALDDGAGCIISWLAPLALKNLTLKTKRTIRTVLWTAEEIGSNGAQRYDALLGDKDLAFVMESDYGVFTPQGLNYVGSEIGECVLNEILKLIKAKISTVEDKVFVGDSGPDIGLFTARGIPGVGLKNDNKDYFKYHHSEGDTLNVINSDILDQDAALWAAVTFVMADIDYKIPINTKP